MAGLLRAGVDFTRACRAHRARRRGGAQAARDARKSGKSRRRAFRGQPGQLPQILPRRHREVEEPREEHPPQARIAASSPNFILKSTTLGKRVKPRSQLSRALGALLVPLVFLLAAPVPAQQDYPTRFITAAAQGGTSDILARVFGARLSEVLKQPVVVDNRASASGVIAGELTANAPPDGYTLLLAYHQHTVNALLNPKLPYHPVNSFTPITQLTTAGFMLVVNPATPVKNLTEFVDWTKGFSGQLNYGSAGNGTGGHLAGELYKQMTGVRAEHIPYKGAGPAMMDLLAGQFHYTFVGLQSAQTLVRAGKLRGLAVTTPKRVAALPDLPAVAEALPGFEVVGWYGVIGPAGLPRPIVVRLHDEFVKILNRPEVRERIVADGSEPAGTTPEEFRLFMLADLAKWAKLVKESGAKLD
ncbi:MAG: tripartite tricarboxylate transporter substrate binding protein [Betaproteobacteria bacterium]|nr:MAG: tripartite tricarboxylate transporter substrate binding protein [Betaproteobacteria bacterium]